MADENKLVIPVETDDSQAKLSLSDLLNIANNISDSLNSFRDDTSVELPGYVQGMSMQIANLERNIDRLRTTFSDIQHASNSFDAEKLTASFERRYESIVKNFNSLKDTNTFAKNFVSGALGSVEAEFSAGISKVYGHLVSELRGYSSQLAKQAGPQSDKVIASSFMNQAAYQQIASELQSKNAQVFSNTNMESYIRSIIPSVIAQYQRSDVYQHKDMRRESSFRDMLPQSFANISTDYTKPVRENVTARADDNVRLTSQEVDALRHIVHTYGFAADNAVAAGLARKENGYIYVNPNATRGMVNSLGGMTMRDIVVGGKGESKYGLKDLEDPANFEKVLNKTNQMITQSLSVARTMHDSFSWLSPEYYAQNGKFEGKGSLVGRITASPRTNSRAFAEYTLDNWKDGYIDGVTPIGVQPGQKARPEDYHTITLRDSIHNRDLENAAHGKKYGHNEFSDNAIYLKIDDALSDPNITAEMQQKFIEQYADAIRNGKTINGRHYRFTRFNQTHLEFVPDDIYEDIGESAIWNGAARTYDNRKDFAKALYVRNTRATESERISDLFGSKLDNATVVVGNFQDELGNHTMDGVNWISSSLTKRGFQGRDSIAKATYAPMDFDALWQMYPELVDKNSGNLVIPGAGINGDNLVIPKGVSMIEDVKNIKNFNAQYGGMTQDEVNAARTAVLREGNLSAKTTFGDANTSSRWLSHQLANTLRAGFEDPEVKRYFEDVFYNELGLMNDEGYVRDTIFGGDQNIDLNTQSAQTRIQNYINSVIQRHNQGDILLPASTRDNVHYRMASNWAPNVINGALRKSGVNTDKYQDYEIGDGEVVSLNDVADWLGIFRYPTSVTGINTVSNVGTTFNDDNVFDPAMAERFDTDVLENQKKFKERIVKLANVLQVDPDMIAFNPSSPILKWLEGEDFDGDINGILSLSSNPDERFQGIVRKLMTLASDANKKLVNDLDGRTEEQLAADKARRTVPTEQDEGRIFSSESPEDMAEILVKGKRGASLMGLADAAQTNAWQYMFTPRMARALSNSSNSYDIVSTFLKEMNEADLSKEEKEMLYGGRSFQTIANWANKALSASADGGHTWDEFAQYEFNKHKNIDSVNLPSAFQGNVVEGLMSRFIAKQRGFDISGGFNWDDVFGNLDAVDKNTASGQLTQRLREVKRDLMKGEYVALSDSLVSELVSLSHAAYGEIEREVNADKNIAPSDKQTAIWQRFHAAGGNVVRNISEFGLTEARLRSDKALANDVFGALDLAGIDKSLLFGQGRELPTVEQAQTKIEENDKKIEQLKKDAQEKEKQAAELEKKIAEEKLKQAQTEANNIKNGEGTTPEDNTKIAEYQKQLSDLQKQKSDNEAQRRRIEEESRRMSDMINGTYNYIKGQEYYGSMISDIDEYYGRTNSKLRKNKAKLDPDISSGDIAYQQKMGQARFYEMRLKEFQDSGMYSALSEEQKRHINELLYGSGSGDFKKLSLTGMATESFRDESLLQSEKLLEDLQKANGKLDGTLSAEEQRIKYFNDKVKDITSKLDKLKQIDVNEKGESTPSTQQFELEANLEKITEERDRFVANTRAIAAENRRRKSAALDMDLRNRREQSFDIAAQAEQANNVSVFKTINNRRKQETSLYNQLGSYEKEAASIEERIKQNEFNATRDNIPQEDRDTFYKQWANDLDVLENYKRAISAVTAQIEAFEKENAEVWNQVKQSTIENIDLLERYQESGGKTKAIASIADDVQRFSENVEEAKKQLDELLAHGAITSEEHAAQSSRLNPEVFRQNVINNSLQSFEDSMFSVGKGVKELEMSDADIIEQRVRKMTESINEERDRIKNRIGDTLLSDDQRARYDRILGHYDQYDEDSYRRQLTEQQEEARRREEERKRIESYNKERSEREALYRSERTLHQTNRAYNRDPFSAGIFGAEYQQRLAYREQVDNQVHQYESALADATERNRQAQFAFDNATDPDEQKKYADAVSDTSKEMDNYSEALRVTKQEQDRLSGSSAKQEAVTNTLAKAIVNVTKQFGRRMFQQAIREARQFVQQFNASMIEIQTITLKTDEEMATIRQTAIDTAIQMRTSVGDVTKVQAELYRQGLDDTEVNSRMQSIIKFATVAKVSTETATKIITTALQNNLVSSAQEAMDSLVALGDSAATTAAEIAKAMQKCAASANVAGVSYGELNAMLTVMTSRTQLSGTQVGTALNTLLSRFRNVTSQKYTKDINGESTSLNEVEAALNLVGINMRNEQGTDFRNPVDVLLDISKRWGSMNDVQMANLSTAMAGTRAANMFNTLMEGMAEDNGELFEKYLRLAEDSEGITDAKYEVAVRGINAALNELKSTFDGLVASLENDNILVGGIDIVTGMTDGVRMLTSALGGLGSIIPIVGAAFGAFMAKTLAATAVAHGFFTTISAANPVLMALGAIAGLAAVGGITKLASTLIPHTPTDEETATKKQEEANAFGSKAQSKSKELNSTLSEMESLLETYEELEKQGEDTSAVNDQLNTSFGKLKSNLPSLKGNIEDTTRSLEDWKTIVDEAKDAIDNFETVSNATRFRLAREAQEAKNDAIESEGSGTQSENDTYSLFSRMTPIIRAGGSSMFVRPEGFDENNPFADATSLKYSMSQVLGYAMNPYSADDALLADVGRMLYDSMMEMPLENRPDYYQAGDTSENGMMQLARRFSENISQSMTGRGITGWSQDAFDSFINSLMEGNILGDYQSGKQSIDDAKKNGYVEGLVQTMLIDPVMSMIGDVGDEEAAVYKSGLTNMMKSAMAENTSLDGMEFGQEYMSALTDIATGLQDELLQKIKDGTDTKNLVDDTADAESFAYRVEEIYDDGDQKTSYYKTLDEAKAYAESAGVPFTAIKDNNTGENVYQTTEQALRSLMQSYKTSNKTYSSQILDLVSILNEDYDSIDDLMSEIDRQHPGGMNDFNAILGTNQNAMLMWNSMLGDNSPFTQEDLRREFLGILSGQTMESTYGLRQRAMNSWLGEDWDQFARNGNLNWKQALMDLGELKETDPGLYNFLQSDVIGKYDGFAEIIQAVGSGAQVTSEMIDKLNNSIMSDGVAALEKYNQYATDVVDTLLKLRGTPDQVISGMSSMNSRMTSLYERNQAIAEATDSSGADLSDATVSTISTQFSISEDQVRALAAEDLKIFVDAMKSAADKENTSMVGEVLARSIIADLNNSLTADQLLNLFNTTGGKIDSNTIGQYEEYLTPATRAMLAQNRLYGNDFSMSVGRNASGAATSGAATNTFDPNKVNAATIRAQYAETARSTAEATQKQLNAWIALGEIAQQDGLTAESWDAAVDQAIADGKLTKDQYNGILKSFPKITKAIGDLNDSAESATDDIQRNVQDAINDVLGISADQHSRNIRNVQTLFGADMMQSVLRGEAFTATNEQRSAMYQAITNIGAEDFSSLVQSYSGLSDVITKINNGQEITVDDLRTLNNAMMTEGVTAADKYNKSLKQIAETLSGLNGNHTDFLQTFTGVVNGITSLHDQMFAINQAEGKNGWELDDETVAQLSKITSFDEQYIKTRNNEQLQRIMPLARRAVEEQYSNQTAGLFGAGFADFINTKNAEYGKNNANKTLTYSSEQLKENSIPWLSDKMKDQLDMMTSDGSSFEIQLKFDENGIATLADYSATMGDFMNWYSNSLVGDTFADTLQNVRNDTSQENTEAITRRSLVEEMRTAYGQYGADFAANIQANTAEVVKQLQDPQLRGLIDLMEGKTDLKLDDMAIDRMLTNFKTGAVSTNDSMNNQFMSFLFGQNWEQDAEQGTLAFQEAYNQLQSLADNPLLSAYASHVLEHFGLSGDALLDYVDDAEDAKDASLEVANVWTSDMSSASNSFKTYLEGVSKNLQTLRSDASDALDAMKSLIEEMHNLNDTEYTIMRNRGRSGLELDERGRQLFLDEGYTNPEIDRWSNERVDTELGFIQTRKQRERYAQQEGAVNEAITGLNGAVRSGEGIQVGNENSFRSLTNENITSLTGTASDLVNILKSNSSMDPEGMVAAQLSRLVEQFGDFTVTLDKNIDKEGNVFWKNGGITTDRTAPSGYSDSYLGANAEETIQNYANSGSYDLNKTIDYAKGMSNLLEMAQTAQNVDELRTKLQGSGEEFNEVINKVMEDGSKVGEILKNMFNNGDNSIYSMSDLMNAITSSMGLGTQNEAVMASGFVNQLGFTSSDLTAMENGTLTDFSEAKEFLDMLESSGQLEAFTNATSGVEGMTAALRELKDTGKITAETQKTLANSIKNTTSRAMFDGQRNADDLAASYRKLTGSVTEQVKEISRLNKELDYANDLAVASAKVSKVNRYKDLDKTTKKVVQDFMNMTDAELSSADLDMDWVGDALGKAAVEGFRDSGSDILSEFSALVQDTMANNPIAAQAFVDMEVVGTDGTVNMDNLRRWCSQYCQNAWAVVQQFAGMLGSLELQQVTLEGGGVGFQIDAEKWADFLKTADTKKYSGGRRGSKGGGGSEKNKELEKLLKSVDRAEQLVQHRLKMLQYKEDYYETMGEWTNMNSALMDENKIQQELIDTYTESINKLQEQLNVLEYGSDDWDKVAKNILKYEEAIEGANNAIEFNNKKIKENQEKIRQLRITLEDMVVEEIKKRIQKQRDMLAATVEMEEIITDAIKLRYQKEWDWVKEDIERKKRALEEEKALIDERLNRRKQAEDEAKKYEELREYRSQLALIQMDPTRTRDAAQLRNKISELESEISWDLAEREAEAAKDDIQDNIDAYTEYVEAGDESLAKFLEDSNNFTGEVNSVLRSSHDDLIAWLKNNVEEYSNSLAEQQEQMVTSWDDTYKQMYGIVDTYWDEVNEILSSKEAFLTFMEMSDDFVNASETMKESMLYQWNEAFDGLQRALKDTHEFVHEELAGITAEIASVNAAANSTSSKNGGGGGGSGGSNKGNRNGSNNANGGNTVYYGVTTAGGQQASAALTRAAAASQAATAILAAGQGPLAFDVTTERPEWYVWKNGNTVYGPATKEGAERYAKYNGGTVSKTRPAVTAQEARQGMLDLTGQSTLYGAVRTMTNTNMFNLTNTNNNNRTERHATGGLASYSGLHWLEEGEGVTDPELTQYIKMADRDHSLDMLKSMFESMRYVSVNPLLSNVVTPDNEARAMNIGDIDITVNVASMNDDADIEDLSTKLGEQFVKELSKKGYITGNYAF